MVRYADDFVVLCRSRQEAEAALEVIRQWVTEAGLTLHPEKTRIADANQKGEGVQTDYTYVLQTVRTWPPELRQNLAGEILESLEADSSTPSAERSQTMNARRCALIDKEIDGTLTPAERVELELLQKQAVAYRDRVAPLPIEGARTLHQQLVARKRHDDQGRRP